MKVLSKEKIETLKYLIGKEIFEYEIFFQSLRAAKAGEIAFRNLINERIDELSHLKEIQQDLKDILNAT